jgi:hypothetical protein
LSHLFAWPPCSSSARNDLGGIAAISLILRGSGAEAPSPSDRLEKIHPVAINYAWEEAPMRMVLAICCSCVHRVRIDRGRTRLVRSDPPPGQDALLLIDQREPTVLLRPSPHGPNVASGSLSRSPVSLSPGDEVPHMFTRKPRLRPEKFASVGALGSLDGESCASWRALCADSRYTRCPAWTHASIPPRSGRIFLNPACFRCLAARAADASFGHAQYTMISSSRE